MCRAQKGFHSKMLHQPQPVQLLLAKCGYGELFSSHLFIMTKQTLLYCFLFQKISENISSAALPMIRLQEQPRQRSTIHPNNGKADRWIDRWGEKELTIYMSQLVIYLYI